MRNAAEPQQTSAGVVEEIIVTSRREEEQIQDVPVAVSAFTQQDITRLAPYTLADMDGLMPNVSILTNGWTRDWCDLHSRYR